MDSSIRTVIVHLELATIEELVNSARLADFSLQAAQREFGHLGIKQMISDIHSTSIFAMYKNFTGTEKL